MYFENEQKCCDEYGLNSLAQSSVPVRWCQCKVPQLQCSCAPQQKICNCGLTCSTRHKLGKSISINVWAFPKRTFSNFEHKFFFKYSILTYEKFQFLAFAPHAEFGPSVVALKFSATRSFYLVFFGQTRNIILSYRCTAGNLTLTVSSGVETAKALKI